VIRRKSVSVFASQWVDATFSGVAFASASTEGYVDLGIHGKRGTTGHT
jgi:hypothetical protein